MSDYLMTIPSYFYPLAAPFLIPVARQLGQQLMNLMGSSRSSPQSLLNVSNLTEKIYNDPRYIEAIIDYSQRKAERILEVQSLALTQTQRQIEIQQQELQERQEISQLQRELIRDLQSQAIQVKLQELDEIWNREKWFSNLSRQETERILVEGTQHHKLLMLAAPPDISSDCPEAFKQHLKKDIANGLRRFLNQHYPETHPLRPVEFYADYFTRPLGDIEVRKLQAVLSPVPTVVLYSDMNDYEMNIHIGFLSINYQSISLIPIHPWNWEAGVEKLQIEGHSHSQALRQVRQFIVTLHQILAALLIDWYYLTIDPNYSPELLNLTQEFSQELIQDYIAIIQKIQKEQRNKHEYKIKLILNNSMQLQEFNAHNNPENWKNAKTIFAHEDRIDALAIFPNNQWITSGSWDNMIKVWSVETGKLQMTLLGHVNAVTSLAVDSFGAWLVSGSVDHTIKIWSVKSQQLHQTLLGHSDAVTALAVSSNAQLIASGSADNTIKIWSIETGELQRTLVGHTNSITAVKINQNGQFVISESADNTIKIWSVATGENEETLMYRAKLIKSVLISQDGQWILSFSWDNWIKIWSVATGELQRMIPGDAQENFMAMSLDRRWIASKSSDQAIQIRCLETGNLIKTLTGHQNEINQMVFSEDGNGLISSSSDGEIKIWRSP